MALMTNPVGVEIGAKYVIVGPDGTRATFNDPADPDHIGILDGDDGVTGLERAGVRESADELPEADGGVHGPFRYSRLTFTLKGLIDHSNATSGGLYAGLEEAAIRAHRITRLLRATDAMLADAELAWTPSSAPAMRVLFRQQQATRITGRRPKAFIVAGVAEQSEAESQTEYAVTIDLAALVVGGMASPLTSPLASSSATLSGATANVSGTRETWPVITITGPIVNPVIRSLRYARELRFTYTLAAGESLVIDTDPRRRTIRLNGQTSRFSALDWTASTWFALAPGPNELRASASSLSAGSSILVAWRTRG